MTDAENRLQNLESKYHDVDKRQDSFETFVKENLRELRDITKELKESNKRLEGKMDGLSAQLHSMSVGFSAGVGAILVAMFIALFFTK